VSLFSPTYTPNTALEYVCQQETRDELLCSMNPLYLTVALLRLEGYTWEEVGEAFGVTKQGAQDWMQTAARQAYNSVPSLRAILRPYVTLCPFCGKAISPVSEMCVGCRAKMRTPTILDSEVTWIREMRKQGMTQAAIGEVVGRSASTICRICQRSRHAEAG